MEELSKKIKSARREIIKTFLLLFVPHLLVGILTVKVATDPDKPLKFQLIYFIAYFISCLLSYFIAPWFIKRRHNNEILSAEYDFKTELMTIKYRGGLVVQYFGSCTVWHKYPMTKRCATSTEAWLCDLYEYNKQWNGPYPTAHIIKTQNK